MSNLNAWLVEKYGPLMTMQDSAQVLKVKDIRFLREKIRSGEYDLKLVDLGQKTYVNSFDVARLFS